MDRHLNPGQATIAVWVSDITYIYTISGLVYLTTFMDLFSRKIIRMYISDNLSSEGVILADNKAKAARKKWGFSHCLYIQTEALVRQSSRLIYCRKATPSIRGNSIVTSVDGNVRVRSSQDNVEIREA